MTLRKNTDFTNILRENFLIADLLKSDDLSLDDKNFELESSRH